MYRITCSVTQWLYIYIKFQDTVMIIMPPPVGGGDGGIKRSSASVRLSDVAYIGSNSKTKRPRKTKLCTGVPQVTCDSHTDFKVKRQGHGAGAYCGGHLAAQLVKNECHSNIIVDILQGCGHSKKLRKAESESRSSKVVWQARCQL